MYLLKTRSRKKLFGKSTLIPGLLLALFISLTSYFLFYILNHKLSIENLSIISIALFIGIITTNTWTIPKGFQPGIKFSLSKILTLAIVLLGFRLNWAEVSLIGSTGLFIIISSLLVTLICTHYLGRKLGLNLKLIQLIACGTSICGTSAIVATNSIIHASEEDVSCAVITVTAFGSLAMILYPLLLVPLGLTQQEFGIWCGSSIHQTSQVVAAGFQQGNVSGELATISKLSRVLFLAPIIFCIGLLGTSTCEGSETASIQSKLPIPLFVIFFLCIICINSLDIIPHNIKSIIIDFDKLLITISMAAVGLETKLVSLKRAGINSLLLGALSWLCLSLISLVLIKRFI